MIAKANIDPDNFVLLDIDGIKFIAIPENPGKDTNNWILDKAKEACNLINKGYE